MTIELSENVINAIADAVVKKMQETKTEPKTEQRWIPCTERLPKHVENVVAYDGLDMFVAWYVPDGLHEGWHSFDNAFDDYTPIIAWTPLPQPYKKEAEA